MAASRRKVWLRDDEVKSRLLGDQDDTDSGSVVDNLDNDPCNEYGKDGEF